MNRVSPDQDDTIADLHESLKKVPTKDCIVFLDDFNEQLLGNVANRTGKWVVGEPSKNTHKIMDLVHMYDLYTANTHFETKRGETVHTYLYPTPKKVSEQGDLGLYVGDRITCKYDGKIIHGSVTAVTLGNSQGVDKWTVQFDDGHTTRCGKKRFARLFKKTPNTSK